MHEGGTMSLLMNNVWCLMGTCMCFSVNEPLGPLGPSRLSPWTYQGQFPFQPSFLCPHLLQSLGRMCKPLGRWP